MCLSSFWNFGAICKMVSKKTILLETPGQSWEGRLNWKFLTIKTKLIYLIPFIPPHYFWFTMALSGPDLQQWQIAHLIVSRPINQGGSSPLRQMVKLCADSPFTLDGCVIVYQLFTSVSSQMWHCLVLEAKWKDLAVLQSLEFRIEASYNYTLLSCHV